MPNVLTLIWKVIFILAITIGFQATRNSSSTSVCLINFKSLLGKGIPALLPKRAFEKLTVDLY